jgi:hypothetical protein
MWSEVQQQARAQTTPLTALAVSGMNDVLNSQSAFYERIGLLSEVEN